MQPAPGAGPVFVPTHRVPPAGLPAWAAPGYPYTPPAATLEAGGEVQLVRSWGDWAQVLLPDGEVFWIDSRQLLPHGPDGESGRTSVATDGDVEALRLQLARALDLYSRALDDLDAGRIDRPSFQRQALRAGLVIRDDDAWILDVAGGAWYCYDGARLRRFDAAEQGLPRPEST